MNLILPKSKRSNSRSYFEFSNFFMPKSKRSQITIFIILALIIVVLIALVFIVRQPPKIEPVDEKSPQAFIESCTKDYLEQALAKISKHGGDISPGFSVMHMGVNLSYLCYTSEYYKTCVNQKPKLIEHIEKEITKDISPSIIECFNSLKTNLDKKNYNVEMGDIIITTKLKPKEVSVEIKRNFKMSRENDVREFNDFKIGLINPMYELAETAMEIVNQESQYCNFDTLGFMIIYPDFDIYKTKTGDSDIIYRIADRKTKKDFNFAIKTCVMPAGV